MPPQKPSRLARWWLGLKRSALLYAIRLFRVRDASERVARGFALGMIVNFFPTFGFGVLISGFFARALGGNAIAGVVGGATLTFAWPLLFYLNMKLGDFLLSEPPAVADLAEVTEKTVNALVWGKTFTVGAIANSILVGLAVYLALLTVHARIRPHALAYFRHHAREHRKVRC